MAAGSHSELKNILKGGLYIVATPIGNMRDITLRALDVLRGCDLILCEDTRVTRKLLNAYDIRSPMFSYHNYSEDQKLDNVLAHLRSGKAVVLVSDAGMPLISDPGYRLVKACAEEGIYVTSLPGANAPLSALQLSGLPTDSFCFLGFLPAKSSGRRRVLQKWIDVYSTLVFFESPRRLVGMLGDLDVVCPGRPVAVVREITKMFEEVKRGSAPELIAYYQAEGAPKGEVVVVAGPPAADNFVPVENEEVERRMRALLKGRRTKEAADILASETGMGRKDAYNLALRIAREED